LLAALRVQPPARRWTEDTGQAWRRLARGKAEGLPPGDLATAGAVAVLDVESLDLQARQQGPRVGFGEEQHIALGPEGVPGAEEVASDAAAGLQRRDGTMPDAGPCLRVAERQAVARPDQVARRDVERLVRLQVGMQPSVRRSNSRDGRDCAARLNADQSMVTSGMRLSG